MKKVYCLLLCLTLFACAKETIEPLKARQEMYYLLVRSAGGEDDLEALKQEVVEVTSKYGNYRISNVYFRSENEHPILVTRRFPTAREADKMVKKLKRQKELRHLEMKTVRQGDYREMLRQRTFYPDWSKPRPDWSL